MKRSLILVLVALLALTLCASVFAASAQAAPAKTFTAIGKVKSVDPGASTMVVHVRLGSVGVKRFIGKDLPLTVASNAKIQLHSGRWFVTISLADLSVGDAVRVSGAISRPATGDPVYVAKHIVAPHILPWMKLKHFGFRGPVTAVDAAAGTWLAHLNAVPRLAHVAGHRLGVQGSRQGADLRDQGRQAHAHHAGRCGRGPTRSPPSAR